MNGLMRAARKRKRVAADGIRTRYPNGLHNGVQEMSGRFIRQLGWYRRISSLVPYFYGIRLFFIGGNGNDFIN